MFQYIAMRKIFYIAVAEERMPGLIDLLWWWDQVEIRLGGGGQSNAVVGDMELG